MRTPGPWKANKFAIIGPGLHDGVAVTCGGPSGEDNAAFIVLACNAHDSLVEVARLFVDADSLEDSEKYQEAMGKARAVLAEMESK